MRDAIGGRVAMIPAVVHGMWCWRRSSVRPRCGRILARVGGCGRGALLVRRVVGEGSVHRRRRDMAGAVVLVVCVVFSAVPWRLVRVVRMVSEWRQLMLVRRRTRRGIGRLDGRQRGPLGARRRRAGVVVMRRRCLRGVRQLGRLREGRRRRARVYGSVWCRRREGRSRSIVRRSPGVHNAEPRAMRSGTSKAAPGSRRRASRGN